MNSSFDTGQLLLLATSLSLLGLLATLVAIPWVVTRLPRDYFARERRSPWRMSATRPMLALLLGIAKNLLGLLLVVLGLLMLVTPGQGLLTLLVGLLLLNFPGKFRLEQWLVRQPGVLRGLNWLRRRRAQEPFDAPWR